MWIYIHIYSCLYIMSVNVGLLGGMNERNRGKENDGWIISKYIMSIYEEGIVKLTKNSGEWEWAKGIAIEGVNLIKVKYMQVWR